MDKQKARKILAKLSPKDESRLLAENLADDIKAVESKITPSKDYSSEIQEVQADIESLKDALLAKLSTLPDKDSVDKLKKNYSEAFDVLDQRLNQLIADVGDDKKELDSLFSDNDKQIDELKKLVEKLKLGLNRGGAQNRQININSSVMSLKYTDMNLLGGITKTDNTTTKQVDVTFAGSVPSIAGTITGGTDGSVLFVHPDNTIAQDNANFFWDFTNKRLGIGNNTPVAAVQLTSNSTTRNLFAANITEKLAIFTIKSTSSFVATGTTTVNSAQAVVGTGTKFLSEVGIGDLLSVSSDSGNFATVLTITDDTHLSVAFGLGNGTTQTINVKKALYRIDDASGNTQFVINSSGQVGVGGKLDPDVSFSLGGDMRLNAHNFYFDSDNNYGVQRFNSGIAGVSLFSYGGYRFVNNDGGGEIARITSTGLGIFQTDPKTALDVNGFMEWNGQKRVTTQFDATTTTLGTVTGLSATVAAGKSYYFKAKLFVTADVVGGQKYAIGGTATATAIIYEILTISNTANTIVISSKQTAMGGSAGQAGGTDDFTTIEGTITVNAGGTLVIQFAQNAANGTSSVLVGSLLEIHQIN